ncbi:pepSY-associated TM helix family protein [Synechococcus sp. A15-44]|nr:pepSY-associated TM helix family protein [Synechococcus sp. A15-44]QNI67361.1 pepSY-associated TM helix family protein [Synechococcus sp. BMK-MC-1]
MLITAGTGSLYSLLLEQDIDAFWLLKIHTGNFGVLNLQPVYPMLLGGLTVIVTVSGAAMLLKPSR